MKFGNELSTEEIDAIAEHIIENWGKVLPTEKEFNELLNLYGIHGLNTG